MINEGNSARTSAALGARYQFLSRLMLMVEKFPRSVSGVTITIGNRFVGLRRSLVSFPSSTPPPPRYRSTRS
jgi:hypothetical protein